MDDKINDLHQNLMDEVYNKWSELIESGGNTDRLEVIEKYFTPLHRIAVQLGNFNYQVENGGFFQWYDNKYAGEDLDDIIDILEKSVEFGIEGADKILKLLYQFRDLGDVNDYSSIETVECPECRFFTEHEDECPECGDEGWIDQPNDPYEEFYYAIKSLDLDSKYYDIENRLDIYNQILKNFENINKTKVTNIKRKREVKPSCKLIGEDGNVFNIIGRVKETLEKTGLKEEAKEFVNKAFQCDDYNKVLSLVSKYVNIT